MQTPGPEHPITISRNPSRLRVLAAGHVIADTTEGVSFTESGRTAHYFPRKDVETGFLSETATRSSSEYAGEAVHYTMLIDGELLEDVAKSYEHPFPVVEALRDYLVFDSSRVEVYAVTDEELNERRKEHTSPPTALP
jgi:uncharacterized protein (DUF427 family)